MVGVAGSLLGGARRGGGDGAEVLGQTRHCVRAVTVLELTFPCRAPQGRPAHRGVGGGAGTGGGAGAGRGGGALGQGLQALTARARGLRH